MTSDELDYLHFKWQEAQFAVHNLFEWGDFMKLLQKDPQFHRLLLKLLEQNKP